MAGSRHADAIATQAADLIDRAASAVTGSGILTPDLGVKATTAQVGTAVADAVRELAA